MKLNKYALAALGITGWALLSILGNSHKKNKNRENNLQKKAMTIWEGEGGNLPPSAPSPSKPGNVVGNSTQIH